MKIRIKMNGEEIEQELGGNFSIEVIPNKDTVYNSAIQFLLPIKKEDVPQALRLMADELRLQMER